MSLGPLFALLYYIITVYPSMKSSHVQWLTSQVSTCDKTGVTDDGQGVTCDTSSVTCVHLWHWSPNMWRFYTVIYWRVFFTVDLHDVLANAVLSKTWHGCIRQSWYVLPSRADLSSQPLNMGAVYPHPFLSLLFCFCAAAAMQLRADKYAELASILQ